MENNTAPLGANSLGTSANNNVLPSVSTSSDINNLNVQNGSDSLAFNSRNSAPGNGTNTNYGSSTYGYPVDNSNSYGSSPSYYSSSNGANGTSNSIVNAGSNLNGNANMNGVQNPNYGANNVPYNYPQNFENNNYVENSRRSNTNSAANQVNNGNGYNPNSMYNANQAYSNQTVYPNTNPGTGVNPATSNPEVNMQNGYVNNSYPNTFPNGNYSVQNNSGNRDVSNNQFYNNSYPSNNYLQTNANGYNGSSQYDYPVADRNSLQTPYRVYVTREGDNLLTIAENELGSSSRWSEIKKLNNLRSGATYFEVGTVIKLPVSSND